MDETLGFLLFALKKQKALPFWGPAYTAHLEVEYKAVSNVESQACSMGCVLSHIAEVLLTQRLDACACYVDSYWYQASAQ